MCSQQQQLPGQVPFQGTRESPKRQVMTCLIGHSVPLLLSLKIPLFLQNIRLSSLILFHI